MNNIEFKSKYKEYLDKFNSYAEKTFAEFDDSNQLLQAMKYSLLNGGKRIRPVIMMAFTDIIHGNIDEILPFALALECIHTYSLIHDDLPALDNDTLRRGQPTSHVKFGEATAILAGDALLNFAFEHALRYSYNDRHIQALLKLSELAGFQGMLNGQKLDMYYEGKTVDEDVLFEIYVNKTGKLISASFVIPSILYNCESENLYNFGIKVGRLFQLSDDLSDKLSTSNKLGKSTGKDEKEDKLTAIKVFGIDGSLQLLNSITTELKNVAKTLDNSGFLEYFIESIKYAP